MTTSPSIGTWGLYGWTREAGSSLIHPDDIDRFSKFAATSAVFRVAGTIDKWLVLEYGSDRFRVAPGLFKPVHGPKRSVGDVVTVATGGCSRAARIVEIRWHYERNRAYYLLEFDGRRSSRWYWDEDLA